MFLDAAAGVLRERLNARVTDPGNPEWDLCVPKTSSKSCDQAIFVGLVLTV